MEPKKTPTFAFKNNMEVKTLNVANIVTNESSDSDMCDDIDELLSDLTDRRSEFADMTETKVNTIDNKKAKLNNVIIENENKYKQIAGIESNTNHPLSILMEKNNRVICNATDVNKEKNIYYDKQNEANSDASKRFSTINDTNQIQNNKGKGADSDQSLLDVNYGEFEKCSNIVANIEAEKLKVCKANAPTSTPSNKLKDTNNHCKEDINTKNQPLLNNVFKRFELKLPKRSIMPEFSHLSTNQTINVSSTQITHPVSTIASIRSMFDDIENDLSACKSVECELRTKLDLANTKLLEQTKRVEAYKLKYYDCMKKVVSKKGLKLDINHLNDELKNRSDELAHVRAMIEMIHQMQNNEIKKLGDRITAEDDRQKKLMGDHIVINRQMQQEIDKLKRLINSETERTTVANNKCKELEIKIESYLFDIERYKKHEAEHTQKVNETADKLQYTDNKVKQLEKQLLDKQSLIERNEDENRQIILINKNLRNEIEDQKKAEKLLIEKASSNVDILCEFERVKSELEYAKNDQNEKTNEIKRLELCNKRLKERYMSKLINNKHQIGKYVKNVKHNVEKCKEQCSKIDSYKQKKLADNLSKYYQNVFDMENNKYKKEKQMLLNQIIEIKAENKKLKKMNKVMVSKSVEPDDKDVWNVFN